MSDLNSGDPRRPVRDGIAPLRHEVDRLSVEVVTLGDALHLRHQEIATLRAENARLREALATVRAEERARCIAVGTRGIGVVNVDGSASHRVFVGSDAPAFAGHHASIVNGRESARGKPWTPAEVVVIPLAALTGGPHE